MTTEIHTSFVPETDEWMVSVIIDGEYDALLCLENDEPHLVYCTDDGKMKKYNYKELVDGMEKAIAELKKTIAEDS